MSSFNKTASTNFQISHDVYALVNKAFINCGVSRYVCIVDTAVHNGVLIQHDVTGFISPLANSKIGIIMGLNRHSVGRYNDRVIVNASVTHSCEVGKQLIA